ncbi:MAG: C40 family peptidase [Pseudomonadota bacterium]
MRPELPTSPRGLRVALTTAICFVVAACSWQDPPPAAAREAVARPAPTGVSRPGPARQTPARHNDAAAMALAQVGEPYRYGGSAPGGFDCSGLVQYAYALAGVALPRTTQAQWRELPRVAVSERRVGDLLFFRIDGRLSHVGLYLGGGQFVHAPRTGTRVRVERLDASFYASRLVGVARPLP